jgi:hypothetical protein
MYNQGEEFEKLTQERSNAWISAISRGADTAAKDILKSEIVCSKHFVSGRPANNWDKYNVDWTVNLGKKKYREENLEAAAQRAERVKIREKNILEQQELEVAAKRLKVNESGQHVATIDFAPVSGQNILGESEEGMDSVDENPANSVAAETQTEEPPENMASADVDTQTEEFNYMFGRSGYQAPDRPGVF